MLLYYYSINLSYVCVTPFSYLAPEVEYTSKGIGGTYGLPADCWSLGAVLHVMLVARFPEFERDADTGAVRLHLPPVLWDNISSQAKELLRGLMTPNPDLRMTAHATLLHPWLGNYAMDSSELQKIAAVSVQDFQAKGGAVAASGDNGALLNESG